MKRIKNLNNYQKVILIVMAALSLLFAVIYPKTIAKVGYKYNDVILVPTVEDGNTVYSGKMQGEQAQFIVSNDNTVVLNYGDKTYGPYTVREDITAIPKDDETNGSMTVEEIKTYCKNKQKATEEFPFGEVPICYKLNGKIFAQPYWNTVYLDEFPDEELLNMIDLAYDTVFAKFSKKEQKKIMEA